MERVITAGQHRHVMVNILILIVIRRANHVQDVRHGVRVEVVLVISRVQRKHIGTVRPVQRAPQDIIVLDLAILPRHRLAMVMVVIHAAINHQTVCIQVLQHQTHAHGHVMQDIMAHPPMGIHHVQHVVLATIVLVGHTVPHVQQLLNPDPQPPAVSEVYPVAVGPTLPMVPVLLTVFAVGISVTLHVYNI